MSGDVIGSGGSYEFSITSTANEWPSKKRYNANIPISELKARLELITGCDCKSMRLKLYNEADDFLCDLVDELSSLSQAASPHALADGLRIHVEDKSGKAINTTSLEEVPKFEISEDAYAKRDDSAIQFMKRHGLGKFKPVDPEEEQRKEAEKQRAEEEEKMKASSMKIGDRCEVTVAKQPKRRGEIAFVGEVHFKPGTWVGVKYDEPVGKNDGSVEGKRYFTCSPKYGGMVRPSQIEVGDFPELDLDEL